jgi:SSS family transporter
MHLRSGKILFLIFLIVVSHYPATAESHEPDSTGYMHWEMLPALPEGLGGQFAGTDGDVFIIAGGSNFPVSLFKGGTKRWISDIIALEPGANEWVSAGSFDEPAAYGVSISTDDGLICIGGANSERHLSTVVRLRRAGGQIEKVNMPSIPSACAYGGGGIIDDVIYVTCGQESPDSQQAMNELWSFDLTQSEAQWEIREPLPGPPRILPATAVQNGALFVFSGAELIIDDEGKTSRRYLTDSYQYIPGEGWTARNPIPAPSVAAPAIGFGASHIFIFGGDDGSLFHTALELGEDHPGFSRTIYAYDTITDSYVSYAMLPETYVTTPVTNYGGKIVIAGGEDRPGHRGAHVYAGMPVKKESAFSLADYAAIIIYFIVLVIMGIYFARREKNTDDFFIASRRIPWWAAGISIFGTQLSAITFLAVPAKSFAEDWVYFLVNMTIILVAPLVIYIYLPFFRRTNITSAYEYLEKRFNATVRLFGSTAFLLFQVGRMGIVLYLPAIVLSAATGFNIYLCILMMGLLATIYTALGGIEAVIWTDVMQVVVLFGGALAAFLIIVFSMDGGFGGLVRDGLAAGKFHMFDMTWNDALTALWVVVIGNIFASLIPYTTDQVVIQRYLTTPTEKEASHAIWINAALTLPASLLFFGLGTALFLYYKINPVMLDPTIHTDAVFPLFIMQTLPAGIAGIVIAGVFAASMSSLDSSLNSMATVVITDIFSKIKWNMRDSLKTARWLTVIFGIFGTGTALLLATFNISSLLDAFREVLGLFGGSLAGLFALGILTRKATGRGALTGALASAAILWYVKSHTDIHFFLYALIGIMSCIVIGYISSLFFKDNKEDIDELTLA